MNSTMVPLTVEERHAGLCRALEYSGGSHTLDDVLAAVQGGEAKLWMDDRATIVTQIRIFPQYKAIDFWLAAGDLAPVQELSEHIIAWAKKQGCTRATAVGRAGWTRAMKALGWRETTRVLEKEI